LTKAAVFFCLYCERKSPIDNTLTINDIALKMFV